MSQKDQFSSYQCCEGRTAIGQHVEFTCAPDGGKEIREFLKTKIRTIDIPATGRVQVGHGFYGRDTRYKIVQHKYAGGGSPGGGGYIEVLEIKNPPDGRWGIVINEHNSRFGTVFTEWETFKQALKVFEECWCVRDTAEKMPKLFGFKRRVICGALTPWFYAIGDEQLIGDYTFPEGLQDDPVYRFGKKFVVENDEGVSVIKTCMGTRFVQYEDSDYHSGLKTEHHFRIVYWNDGSVWDESRDRSNPPRLAKENEFWIDEAVQKFHQFLSGKSTEFSINFTDGNKFVGKLVKPGHRKPCAEGDYYIVAHTKGSNKPQEGWVNNFKPTPELPDIIQFVAAGLKGRGKVAERIEVKKCRVKKDGKKWAGAFFRF